MKVQTDQTFDARELAKFFRWLKKHAGFDPLSAEAAAMVDKFKQGQIIIIKK